jgi:hypothetical protein
MIFIISKLGNFNIMEKNETTSPPKHDGRTKAIDENSDPDSISKIKMEEKMVKKINQDICEITERITKKVVYNILYI